MVSAFAARIRSARMHKERFGALAGSRYQTELLLFAFIWAQNIARMLTNSFRALFLYSSRLLTTSFDTFWSFSTLFDSFRLFSTLFDSFRLFLTLFDSFRHFSTLYDSFRLFSTLLLFSIYYSYLRLVYYCYFCFRQWHESMT